MMMLIWEGNNYGRKGDSPLMASDASCCGGGLDLVFGN